MFQLGVRSIPAIIEKFKAVKPGLHISAIARQLDVSHNTAATWAKIAGYPTEDGRGKKHWKANHPSGNNKADWTKADWNLVDQEIAEKLGVCRTRVWQKRKELSRLTEHGK